MITTILNAKFGGKYEHTEFSELPFVCDVRDQYICKMGGCPLAEPHTPEKKICDTKCIHFIEHE